MSSWEKIEKYMFENNTNELEKVKCPECGGTLLVKREEKSGSVFCINCGEGERYTFSK